MIDSGILQSGMDMLLNASLSNDGILSIDDIARWQLHNRNNEMDSHIGIAGFNGSGKSILGIQLGVASGGIKEENFVYAYHSHEHLIERLSEPYEEVIFVDELTKFFAAKENMSKAQIRTFQTIEIARAHKNSMISCFREVSKINNNYRNGKLMLLLQMVERYNLPNNKIETWAAVMLANPYYEGEDKFFLSQLRPSFNVIDYTNQLQQLKSFIGYLPVPDIHKNKKAMKLLKDYESKKELGIQSVSTSSINALKYQKEKYANSRAAKQSKQKSLFEVDE